MAKRRTPPDLGLHLCVLHRDSATIRNGRKEVSVADTVDDSMVDADGHVVWCEMGRMGGACLVEVDLRRGMSAPATAAILRKIADAIERYPSLMNVRQGAYFRFDSHGILEKCPLSLDEDYDDCGNLTTPNLNDQPKKEDPDEEGEEWKKK